MHDDLFVISRLFLEKRFDMKAYKLISAIISLTVSVSCLFPFIAVLVLADEIDGQNDEEVLSESIDSDESDIVEYSYEENSAEDEASIVNDDGFAESEYDDVVTIDLYDNTDEEDLGIEISKDSFPDDVFRSYITSRIDADHNGYLSVAEIDNTRMITIGEYGSANKVADLTGINVFTSAEDVIFDSICDQAVIDLRGFTKLRDVIICSANIEKLIVDNASTINQITVDNCTVLPEIINCSSLGTLYIHRMDIAILDISSSSCIKSICVEDCNYLTTLDCNECANLSSLTIRSCSEVRSISFMNSNECANLSSLTIQSCPEVRSISFMNSNVGSFSIDSCSSLEELICDNSLIDEIYVPYSACLKKLSCNNCPNLHSINSEGCNNLTSLSFAGCNSMWELNCMLCPQITSLDFTGCEELTRVKCDECDGLTSIDLTSCNQLEAIYCGYCDNLTNLSLGNQPKLERLDCTKSPKLTSVTVNNYPSDLDVNIDGCPVKDIQFATIDVVEAITFTGEPLTPNVTISIGCGELIFGEDYIVSYKNNTNVGFATVTVTGTGDYYGSKDAEFRITRSVSDLRIEPIGDCEYTGAPITPTVTVTENDKTLELGVDYEVSYKNNTNVGTATVVITGRNGYSDNVETSFRIIPKSISVTISPIERLTYTGAKLTPSPEVIYNGTVLTENTDYTVSYSNNLNVGTATVTVVGKGIYSFSTSAQFEIERKSINISSITVSSITPQTYTGYAITPEVQLSDGNKLLQMGKDYVIVKYTNNINVNRFATVVINGIGNYTGTRTQTFSIVAMPISSDMIAPVEDQVYTGSRIQPVITRGCGHFLGPINL